MSDFEDQLLKMSDIPLTRLHKFSCGHVISPDNILPIALGRGPSGSTFEFKFENRGNSEMVRDLNLLSNYSAPVIISLELNISFSLSTSRCFSSADCWLI